MITSQIELDHSINRGKYLKSKNMKRCNILHYVPIVKVFTYLFSRQNGHVVFVIIAILLCKLKHKQQQMDLVIISEWGDLIVL